MTRPEELANTQSLRVPVGPVSDEDLETVTGGLMRPLAPGSDTCNRHEIDGLPDTGHDETGDV